MSRIKNISKKVLIISIALIAYMPVINSGVYPEILKWENSGISIELNDYLNIPEMSWPETLLEYPVSLEGAGISSEADLVLMDCNSNRSIPFQLSGVTIDKGKLKTATLCFFSGLDAGNRKKYKLTTATGVRTFSEESPGFGVKVISDGNQIDLSNEFVTIRIFKQNNQSPGNSILKIGNEKGWLGEFLLPFSFPVLSSEIKEISSGRLKSEYSIGFHFKNNREYKLKIKLVSGMEFFEIEEDMIGFLSSDSVSAKLQWSNFIPEYRYCPNRTTTINPKGEKYADYEWERIEGGNGNPDLHKHPYMPFDQQNFPDGMLPFKLDPYHNWMSWWRVHTAAFWNEKTGQSIGLFIKDFEKWIDPAFPLWGSKNNMSVRYYYHDNKFHWEFPLTAGKRSVAIALYPHKKDVEVVEKEKQPLAYVDYLRRWYGWISLDKTKEWILDYSSGKPVHPPFFICPEQKAMFNTNELLPKLVNQVKMMATAAERSFGPNPVRTRIYYDEITPLFEGVEKRLTEEEYRQARAYYLFMTYVFMDEALMPMRNMLSGHPNFLADIKGVPGMAAYLFPDHPQASVMADHFEKSVALNLRYHIRPDEPLWNTKGGRSTENAACYTWAFLRPTLKTTFLMNHFYDGKNRILQPNISLYGDWLLNMLTSPLDIAGGKRGISPQGAHAREVSPPDLLNLFGQELKYYDPLLAEKLLWVSNVNDQGFETPKGRVDPWDAPVEMVPRQKEGTNPRLKSAKYTGYGLILRKDFGTPGEMYVHLQQIDEGPNYRWGRAAKGGNGVIYYCADGKRYSYNGVEDVGDAPFGDTERCTNFGIKREGGYRDVGEYRSIGRNDLTDPLYDFDFAQFASINGAKEISPEYKSRSILMAGNDYILVYDDVNSDTISGRFSWFVGKEDDFPGIYQLKPGVKPLDADIRPSQSPYHKDPDVLTSKGRYYDGKGDFLTLVTHKKDLKPVLSGKMCRVGQENGDYDLVFRSDGKETYHNNRIGFEGTAGIIRVSPGNKKYQAALFQGNKIGIPGISLQFKDTPERGALSVENSLIGFQGRIELESEEVTYFLFDKKVFKTHALYINGTEVSLKIENNGRYSVKLPAGKYSWQLSNKGAIPSTPSITNVVNTPTGCRIYWSRVPGAVSYLLQRSVDGGKNWNTVQEQIRDTSCNLSESGRNARIHLRVVAVGEGVHGDPSNDYPVFLSDDKPHAPEGLLVIQNNNKAIVSWGRILGVSQYTLYARKKGNTSFEPVYKGENRVLNYILPDQDIYEFCVTATNVNGESSYSAISDTDTKRLINWYPVPGEIFRRDTESHENGFEEYNPWIEQEMPVLTYPSQEK